MPMIGRAYCVRWALGHYLGVILFLTKLAVGLALFGTAIAITVHVQSAMRGWTRAQRARVFMIPITLLVAYYLIAFAVAGLDTWWVVPTGFATAALLEVVTLRLVQRRFPQGPLAG